MAKSFTPITKKNKGATATGFAAYQAKLRETTDIAHDDETGELLFVFAANSERGAGGQVVPVAEMPAVIEYLNDVAANGIPASDGGVLAIIRNSIKVEDDYITFRTTNGQGAKPMKIAVSAFPQVVDEIEKIFGGYQSVISAEKAKLLNK